MMAVNNTKPVNERTFSFKMQEEADPKELASLDKFGRGLALLIKTVKDIRLELPDVLKVRGAVDVSSLPPVRIDNLADLGRYFTSLETRIGGLASAISSIPVDSGKKDDFEALRGLTKGLTAIEKAVKGLEKSIQTTPAPQIATSSSLADEQLGEIKQVMAELLDFERNKVTLSPSPVTNMTIRPSKTLGWTPKVLAAQSNIVSTVSSAAGVFGGYFISNSDATNFAYVQIFDTTGSVTLGVTTPKIVLGIPPTAGANIEFSVGIPISAGIKLAVTSTATGAGVPTSPLDMTILYL